MGRAHFYKLDGHVAVPMENVLEYAEWFEKTDRTVVRTVIEEGMFLSTVFLGIDHDPFGEKPILFETALYAKGEFHILSRYETWEQAEEGHDEILGMVLGGLRERVDLLLDEIEKKDKGLDG